MSSDFKDVLRERVEDLVRNRLSDVEAAIRAAQTEMSESVGRLLDSVAASTVNYAEDPVFDQLSNEIKAQVGQAAAESTRLSGDLALLRDAVIDIDSQVTQADVLNVLVERAANFAPRVVLFVIKGQDAIAWAARGFNDEIGDDAVRGLSVSLQGDTVLGSVLHAGSAFLGVPGDHADNAVLLDRLGTVNPERIAGIPLRVRTKVAAVLYADTYDTSVGSISMEALELLVHSAGIIVELASLRQRLGDVAPPPPSRPAADPYATTLTPAVASAPQRAEAPVPREEPEQVAEVQTEPEPAEAAPEAAPAEWPVAAETPVEEAPSWSEPAYETPAEATFDGTSPEATPSFDISAPVEPDASSYEISVDTVPSDSSAEASFMPGSTSEPPVEEPAPAYDESMWQTVDPEVEPASEEAESAPVEYEVPVDYSLSVEPEVEVSYDMAPEAAPAEIEIDPMAYATDSVDAPPPDMAQTERPEPAAGATVATARATAPQPGELSEEEEKRHNDARRFARLLVSEIKLYYEQRVAEGRVNNDLYARLKEEIDRSRQMYEKRVDPVVADRFDYFYDELLNTLAQGDAAKLGPECPGPTV